MNAGTTTGNESSRTRRMEAFQNQKTACHIALHICTSPSHALCTFNFFYIRSQEQKRTTGISLTGVRK